MADANSTLLDSFNDLTLRIQHLRLVVERLMIMTDCGEAPELVYVLNTLLVDSVDPAVARLEQAIPTMEVAHG